MRWHAPIERYAPFTVRGIYTLKVAVATLLLVLMINFFKLPDGSGLVCIAPMMMVAADRLMVRDVVLQVPLGFTLGVVFACLWIYWIGPVWPIALVVVCLWAAFFMYIGETSPILGIPCRIIAIMPAIFFTAAGFSQTTSLLGIAELLLLLSFVGIGGFYLLDHLLFPIQYNHPVRKPWKLSLQSYFQRFCWNDTYFIMALQIMCVILVIMGLAYGLGFPNASMVTTALVSCVVVSTALFEKLQQNIRYRVLGNIMGGIWGFACLWCLSYFTFTWLMLALITLTISFFAYLSQNRLTWMSISTQAVYAFIAVIDPAVAFDGSLMAGLTRLGGVLYGCLIAYTIHWVIWSLYDGMKCLKQQIQYKRVRL